MLYLAFRMTYRQEQQSTLARVNCDGMYGGKDVSALRHVILFNKRSVNERHYWSFCRKKSTTLC